MSTISTRPRPIAAPLTTTETSVAEPGDLRIAIRDVSWEVYDMLSDAIGEGQPVHLAYDGRDLEIMATGRVHENFKELLGPFVREVALSLELDFRGGGQTTWKRPEVNRGIEADLCFYFDPRKLEVDRAALARKSNDVADYPSPDLAIEIDLSPSKVDRPGIYAALQVPEVWRFDGESVSIEQLGPDGTYVAAVASRFLHVRPAEIRRWLIEEDSSKQVTWTRRLRDWIQLELVPRMNA